jgi:hypothetical protein
MRRPRLKEIEVLANFNMKLVFVNDALFTVDFKPFFEENKGLLPLQDPTVFAGAVVDEWGWTVEWPAFDIQIGADTMWLDAQAQNAPNEAARFFTGWRSRNGLGLKQASEALGLTPRTISAYSNGARIIPKVVTLACKGWEAERKAA